MIGVMVVLVLLTVVFIASVIFSMRVEAQTRRLLLTLGVLAYLGGVFAIMVLQSQSGSMIVTH